MTKKIAPGLTQGLRGGVVSGTGAEWDSERVASLPKLALSCRCDVQDGIHYSSYESIYATPFTPCISLGIAPIGDSALAWTYVLAVLKAEEVSPIPQLSLKGIIGGCDALQSGMMPSLDNCNDFRSPSGYTLAPLSIGERTLAFNGLGFLSPKKLPLHH